MPALFDEQYGRFASGVPRLYPEQEFASLSNFMEPAHVARIQEFPRVAVSMFASERGDETEDELGWGLSRILTRDLMFLTSHSIHGNLDLHDEALWYRRHVETFMKDRGLDRCFVGRLGRTDEGLVFRLRLRGIEGVSTEEEIHATELGPFLEQVTRLAVGMLGTTIRGSLTQALQTGRPSSFSSLRTFGQLVMKVAAYDEDRSTAEETLGEIKQLIRKLRESDPDFVLPLAVCPLKLLEGKTGQAMLIDAFKRDPFDASLCLTIALTLWDGGSSPQPEAVQFLRRAIELSPGFGPAHLYLPLTAPDSPMALGHAELAHRLLPKHGFAALFRVQAMRKANRPTREIVPVAKEGVAADKFNPGNYHHLVEVLKETGEYREALHFAERLHNLLSPPVNARTKHCMTRSALVPLQLHDPSSLKQLQKTIKWLRAQG